MTSKILSIRYTPEAEDERMQDFHANVNILSSRAHPNVVHGRITNAAEEQIIHFELAFSPVTVAFKGQLYEFASLDREGTFTLNHRRLCF
jgi:hypothetical protein